MVFWSILLVTVYRAIIVGLEEFNLRLFCLVTVSKFLHAYMTKYARCCHFMMVFEIYPQLHWLVLRLGFRFLTSITLVSGPCPD